MLESCFNCKHSIYICCDYCVCGLELVDALGVECDVIATAQYISDALLDMQSEEKCESWEGC